MAKALIRVELTDDGQLRTVVKAGMSMDRLGQTLAAVTRAGITAHLKAHNFPKTHREPLEAVVTNSYVQHLSAGAPNGSKSRFKKG